MEITCSDPGAFRRWTLEELYKTVDTIAVAEDRCLRGDMTKELRDDIQGVAGLGYNREGLLGDGPLRGQWDPIAAVTYDWVHTFLQHGVFTVEVEALLPCVRAFGVTRNDIQAFLRDERWCFPQFTRSKQTQLHKIFDQKRVSDTAPTKLKCSCSELVGVYGMLRLR